MRSAIFIPTSGSPSMRAPEGPLSPALVLYGTRLLPLHSHPDPNRSRRYRRNRVLIGPIIGIRNECAVRIERTAGQESRGGVLLIEQVDEACEYLCILRNVVRTLQIDHRVSRNPA